MVRCQRSIGSWCLFSKRCPCCCSKRQASVGCKYTLFPCIIPLSKGTFQTFGCLVSSFFPFHYISSSLFSTRLLCWNKTEASNSGNNPFRRKQHSLCTLVDIAIFVIAICGQSVLRCYLDNMTKMTTNVYWWVPPQQSAPTCIEKCQREMVDLSLFSKVDCMSALRGVGKEA